MADSKEKHSRFVQPRTNLMFAASNGHENLWPWWSTFNILSSAGKIWQNQLCQRQHYANHDVPYVAQSEIASKSVLIDFPSTSNTKLQSPMPNS